MNNKIEAAVYDAYLTSNKVECLLPPPQTGVRFSIVIPAFNEVEVIAKTLESLKSQTVKNFEVIIVDNNSTDETVAVVKKFIDDNPDFTLYSLSQPVKGPGHARKMGMDQVIKRSDHGRRLQFILDTDADIKLPLDWVQKITEVVDSEAPDVVCGEVSYFDDIDNSDLRLIDQAKRYLSRNLITQYLGCNLSISTDAYVAIGGITQPHNRDGSLAAGEDVEMVEKIIKLNGKVALSNSCVQMDPRRYLVNLLQGDKARPTIYSAVFDDIRDSSALNEALKRIPPEYFVLFKERLMKSQFKRHIIKVFLSPDLKKKLWPVSRKLVEPLGLELEKDLGGQTVESVDFDQLWDKYREVFLNNLERVTRTD